MSTQDIILVISAAVGIILAVIFKLVPVLARWFYSIPEDWRGLSMVGMVFVASLGVLAFSCSQLFVTVPCTQEGALGLLKAFLVMIGTNQVTYNVTNTSPTKIQMQNEAIKDALNATRTWPGNEVK